MLRRERGRRAVRERDRMERRKRFFSERFSTIFSRTLGTVSDDIPRWPQRAWAKKCSVPVFQRFNTILMRFSGKEDPFLTVLGPTTS